MSDAERPGRPERLDWGGDPEPAGPTEPPAESGEADVKDSEANDDADEGELCVIEDPTCEACQ